LRHRALSSVSGRTAPPLRTANNRTITEISPDRREKHGFLSAFLARSRTAGSSQAFVKHASAQCTRCLDGVKGSATMTAA
jgi:hypothetical protein